MAKTKIVRSINALVSFSIFTLAVGVTLLHPSPLSSANLTTVKDTLQSSRISFNGRVESAGTATGGSNVRIKSAASAPSNSITTAGLKAGDTIHVNTRDYTIVGIVDETNFTVTPAILSPDATDATLVYLVSKPQHVITFSTATAVPDGFFQVLIPADSNASTTHDGIPDDAGFDFNTGGSIVVSGTDASGYDFPAAAVATYAGNTGCTSPANYHCFEFHYSGNGAPSTAITLTIGSTATPTYNLINPAPAASHVEGAAGTTASLLDTYPIIVKNFSHDANPNTASPTDQTTARVAVIEPVRVTATVAPQITFQITGVAASTQACGSGGTLATDVATDTGDNAPLAVPFGSISINQFYDAAHTLTVSTNAGSGYTVTAQENDQLGKGGATTPFIPDTSGDGGSVTETVSGAWDTATAHPGFGFTEKAGTGSPTVAVSSTGTSFVALRFPSVADPDTPLVTSVMSNTSVANSETASMCYRITVDATQAAGDYENQITYTATGNF